MNRLKINLSSFGFFCSCWNLWKGIIKPQILENGKGEEKHLMLKERKEFIFFASNLTVRLKTKVSMFFFFEEIKVFQCCSSLMSYKDLKVYIYTHYLSPTYISKT